MTPETSTDELWADEFENDGIDYTQPPLTDGEQIAREAAEDSARYLAYWDKRLTEAADSYDRDRQRLADEYRRRVDALTERRVHELGKIQEKRDFHAARVANYHARILAETGKRSIDLVAGTSHVTVYKKPRLKIDDKFALTEWAEVHRRDLLKFTATVPHTAIEAAVSIGEDMSVVDAELGVPVPGVSASVSPPVYTFDPDRNGPW